MIEWKDWRYCLRVVSIPIWVITFPTIFFVYKRRKLKKKWDFSVLKDKNIIIFFFSILFLSLGLLGSLVFLIPFSEDKGLTGFEGALLISIIGVSSIVGRVFFGFLGDKLGRLLILRGAVVLLFTCYLFWSLLLDNFVKLTFFSIFYGTSSFYFIYFIFIFIYFNYFYLFQLFLFIFIYF